ncbi:uncharacterized protein LOC124927100 [Impatiens glandulifera]|uniref:uncharacterized protein LOC124927100 n=1 Tax=Impatiens glandulifera TaxID=253017 RepID=UPI001FB19927|nr:uncharacterized protein LOC124927100 [Impatiens glandulifera]
MGIKPRSAWISCLGSAFRTAMACAFVGGVTLFGPDSLNRHLALPAFSYVTVILIVTDATLGDSMRGCWHAAYATCQGVVPAILALWLIGPARLSAGTTAVMVAISAFAVVLPESTHLVAKRIALGQIVLVYVIAYINGVDTHPVMHPVHVAASTALGAIACLLALMLPFPSLASLEVRDNCKLLAENVSDRLKLLVKALCADDNSSAQSFISQAKYLAISAPKFLNMIKSRQESMQWEKFPVKFLLKPDCMNPGDRFQGLEAPLRGMEMALACLQSSQRPVQTLQQELKDEILLMENRFTQTLKRENCNATLPFDHASSTSLSKDSESNDVDNPTMFFQTLQNLQDLPTIFFMFCLNLLVNKPMANSSTKICETKQGTEEEEKSGFSFPRLSNLWAMRAKNKRAMAAFKASISLGLAVLLGSLYSKPNGFWSGLPVAISLAAAREPAFKVANLKAQGTVLGTVYGVLGCFFFGKYVKIRFLSLLPWFVFTSFLRRSRMYGPAGGISAVIGAVLILGRNRFGGPRDFAIARIVETFIGLSCSVMVDLLFQPTRASTLAKTQLAKMLGALHECIDSITFTRSDSNQNLDGFQKKLQSHLNEFKKVIDEAEVEPNFWFLPFKGSCYSKLAGSLSKMSDLLLFTTQSIAHVEHELIRRRASLNEEMDMLEGDIGLYKKMLCPYLKSLEQVSLMKSLVIPNKVLQKRDISHNLEEGELPNESAIWLSNSGGEEMEKIIKSYLQHSSEMVEKVGPAGLEDGVGDLMVQSRLCMGLCALGFCMNGVIREAKEIEKAIQEIIQWENPTSHVDLHEIVCKLRI